MGCVAAGTGPQLLHMEGVPVSDAPGRGSRCEEPVTRDCGLEGLLGSCFNPHPPRLTRRSHPTKWGIRAI